MNTTQLISTIKERCKVCYTCVRKCPAKAIRINRGQAEVIAERCISCGSCIKFCTQKAKQIISSIGTTEAILNLSRQADNSFKVAACLAPSFPAAYEDIAPEKLVAMLRALGFDFVFETAFAADLVAITYKRFLETTPSKKFITSPCPAIVHYVEKYHPNLVSALIPIVSPMIAMARIIHSRHGDNVKVIFIGPCTAKKMEALRFSGKHFSEIDEVLTFDELNLLFKKNDISPATIHLGKSPFDPPHPRKGHLFPIGRGILETADIEDNLMKSDVISAEGTKQFIEVLNEFEEGSINEVRLLDPLCCNGCIMGPGISCSRTKHYRQTLVSRYAREQFMQSCEEEWQEEILRYQYLDLNCKYSIDDKRIPPPSDEDLNRIYKQMGKSLETDMLNCGACGYITCRDHATAIHKGLAETEMCLPYTIDRLKQIASELSESYEQLASTKKALIQHEKLASMGQLAAGIAHEVNNPLGVILLYSNILFEETPVDDKIHDDLKLIVEQANRCKKIVSGLLNFSRKNRINIRPTRISELIGKTVKTIIHPGNIRIKFHPLNNENIVAEIDPDQYVQVINNLLTNAIEAMQDGGTITITVTHDEHNLIVSVRDNGPGIKDEIQKKIFEPFFTTKQMGKGTGLGLAVSYGIMKMHRGQIVVKSNADAKHGDTGSEFILISPLQGPTQELISE
ncbi:MAG: GHKL domain-containing protein [Oligoflexia bacterium]|nr:GHKL domain-containing protein [Oligoflexia bacterium]MBF0366468.1 GHKL domain-containing protein [Oligoflexia bacterium]